MTKTIKDLYNAFQKSEIALSIIEEYSDISELKYHVEEVSALEYSHSSLAKMVYLKECGIWHDCYESEIDDIISKYVEGSEIVFGELLVENEVWEIKELKMWKVWFVYKAIASIILDEIKSGEYE